MVTNPVTQTMLMIGGFNANSTLVLNDVWELNPQDGAWNERTTFGAPTPRFDHALAYHPGTFATDGPVYMFGGTPFLDEMWEFNPYTDTWANVTPATSPSGRRKSAMAFLPGLGRIVMFGGEGTGLVARNDTWSWNRQNGSWTTRKPRPLSRLPGSTTPWSQRTQA